jgi:hypothetical protein
MSGPNSKSGASSRVERTPSSAAFDLALGLKTGKDGIGTGTTK